MATDIQLKRSSVSGRVPDAANVQVGEPVVNLADKILFTKDGSGNVIVIGAGTTSNVIEGTNLYFSNARVKTAISTQTLDNATFSGTVVVNNELTLGSIGGDEGGQINFGKPVTNSTLSGNVSIDIYQNRLRIFESSGTNRGAFIDLTAANDGVGSDLLSRIYNGNSEVRIAVANSSIFANVSGHNAIKVDRYGSNANIMLRGQVQDASGRTLRILDEGGNVVWGN